MPMKKKRGRPSLKNPSQPKLPSTRKKSKNVIEQVPNSSQQNICPEPIKIEPERSELKRRKRKNKSSVTSLQTVVSNFDEIPQNQVLNSEEKVPSFVGKVPSFVGKVPSFVGKVPSFVGKVPSFVGKVPSIEERVPSIEKRVPNVEDQVTRNKESRKTRKRKSNKSLDRLEPFSDCQTGQLTPNYGDEPIGFEIKKQKFSPTEERIADNLNQNIDVAILFEQLGNFVSKLNF
jgi:hypothetical protein